MRRADRLFQLVQILRRGRVTTAAQVARELEVSDRTVYRDVADLIANGVPIEGEAGVGYLLPASFDLPPLMFDSAEIEALVLGARMVQSWGDDALARAAKNALAKVEQALPDRLRHRIARTELHAPDFHIEREKLAALGVIRAALDGSHVLAFEYTDERAARSSRRARPLGLFFWGRTWTLTAWCETRRDFRNFRVDRMEETRALDKTFAPEPGRTLEDFLRVAAEQRCESGDVPKKIRQSRPLATRERRVPAVTKPPKLNLTDDERRALRDARISLTEIAALGAEGMMRRTGGAMPRSRCEEIVALADFQRLGSIGLECARDLVQLGMRRVEDLVGKEPIELYDALCRATKTRQDPCVEDALRCAVAQAEDPELAPELRDWWRWGSVRGRPRGARPDLAASPKKRRRA